MKTTPNQTPRSTEDQILTDADHQSFMTEALAQAQLALEQGEIPVGCVIVRDGAVIGRGHNEKEGRKDPSAHAEVLAIQDAARRIGDWRLNGCVLYVTLEPCPMCASLITQSRIREVHVALHEVQSGALGTVLDLTHDPLNHIRLRVKWDYRPEAEALLNEFFQSKKRKPGGTGDESERL